MRAERCIEAAKERAYQPNSTLPHTRHLVAEHDFALLEALRHVRLSLHKETSCSAPSSKESCTTHSQTSDPAYPTLGSRERRSSIGPKVRRCHHIATLSSRFIKQSSRATLSPGSPSDSSR
jgi:hypothetical protein